MFELLEPWAEVVAPRRALMAEVDRARMAPVASRS
jgi:hypothetical protein